METLYNKIVSLVVAPFIFLGSLFSPTPQPAPVVNAPVSVQQNDSLGSSNAIETPVALFSTTLANSISSSATTMTLTSATTKDGTSLASSTYSFIIDEGTASEEFVKADCTGTACIAMERGLSVVSGTTTIASLQKSHRRGASVKITDAPLILNLTSMINGGSSLPNKLKYTSHPTFSSNTDIVDKKYADDTIAGLVGTATDSAFGTVKLSTAAASTTNPVVVGDNDTRVPTQGENDALVGDDFSIAVGSGNKFVTQTGLQKMSESYATSTTASSTALLLTLSPAPTSLTAGMEVNFKASTSTTGATTLTLLGLATTTIKKMNDQDLISGDIESDQIVKVKYDGTYWQMISPLAQSSGANFADIQTFTASSTWTKPANAKKVLVQLWGAGGSGSNNLSTATPGCAGGGGQYVERWLNADDLTATVAVTIGAGGVAVSTNDTNGNAGGSTTFGAYETAGGGGAGGAGAGGAGGAGGNNFATVANFWGAGGSSSAGGNGIYSAGGGAFTGSNPNYQASAGGNSRYGGAGGGGVGQNNTTAAGGTSTYGGAGGASASGANATAGSVPGGGGGAVTHNSGTFSSGAGAAGKAIVTTFF